jgi:hypothetical protein
MNRRKKYELIEKFNTGELTGVELERFTRKMEKDKDFAIEVKLNKDVEDFLIKHMEKITIHELDEICNKVILEKKKSVFKKALSYLKNLLSFR